jgi:hypothetical protein
MSLSAFPNGVSSFGCPILPASIPEVITGNVFFVHSGTGADTGSSGKQKETPFKTIDYAIGKCTADKGDVIYVMPGHADTISAAAGILLDVAGVSIIGLGRGLARPIITMNTAATATFSVTAANCLIRNIIFNANFADIATAIIVSGKDCTIENCLFKEHAVDMNFFNCIRTGAVANGADGLAVIRNERISVDAAALAFVSILENTDRLKVIGNFDNQASAADVGHFITMVAFVCLGAQIIGNILNLTGDNNAQTVAVFMTGSSTTSTGVVAYNLCGDLDTGTELFDTATLDFQHFENYKTGTIALSGRIMPAMEAA